MHCQTTCSHIHDPHRRHGVPGDKHQWSFQSSLWESLISSASPLPIEWLPSYCLVCCSQCLHLHLEWGVEDLFKGRFNLLVAVKRLLCHTTLAHEFSHLKIAKQQPAIPQRRDSTTLHLRSHKTHSRKLTVWQLQHACRHQPVALESPHAVRLWKKRTARLTMQARSKCCELELPLWCRWSHLLLSSLVGCPP